MDYSSQFHEDYMQPQPFHIDYDLYTQLCKDMKVKPQLPVKEGKTFYEHFYELLGKQTKKKK